MKNYKNVIGENPVDIVSSHIQQIYNDTCAIKSQQLILEDFGIHRTEDQLVQQAEVLHLYYPGNGTSPEDVGKLLIANGVPCTQHQNSSIFDLTAALAKGEKIIIGVDSSELWNNNPLKDLIFGEQADHALIVAGIDTSDPNNVQVILTDPGSGQEGARYPIDQFLDAWHDSGNFMVTTDAPVPLEYNHEMINFDYSIGHLPAIGHIPYNYFNDVLLSLDHNLPPDFANYDVLYNDFNQMVDGDIHNFSPELVNAIHQIPDFINTHHIDLSHGFDPYQHSGMDNINHIDHSHINNSNDHCNNLPANDFNDY